MGRKMGKESSVGGTGNPSDRLEISFTELLTFSHL